MTESGLAAKEGTLQEGDLILKVKTSECTIKFLLNSDWLQNLLKKILVSFIKEGMKQPFYYSMLK